ncbi:N-acetylglucosamine-6-phosphate deacetylase [Georgenia daeguensis]|uniref:N-acetylglucosamine-6-phosphate deacetylase n=1 Tax=Georgenia daeguensis TaxID=908355 RepID=UPI0031EA9853
MRSQQPGLVDLQVNGFAGHDVNADDVTPEVVVELTRALWREGVTRYLPTIVTAGEEKILRALRAVAEARTADEHVAASIVGVHVEGPALSPADGARGAHDLEHLRDPDPAELDRWQQACGGLVRIVTLAPERPGSAEYVAAARASGVVVSVGHTAATADEIRGAAHAGATLATHVGNGCRATLPRHPNHLWAILAEDRLTAMLIADGHHLPPDTLTTMIRAKSPERCVLTSDSAALAGRPPGDYETPVGGAVTVGEDGRLTLAGTSLLAGSGRSLRACLDWAGEHLPFDETALLAMATGNPARVLGIEDVAAGDVVEVEREDGTTRVLSTTVAGATVYRA